MGYQVNQQQREDSSRRLTEAEKQELASMRSVHFDWYSCEMALILSFVFALCFWIPFLKGQDVSLAMLIVTSIILTGLLICFISLTVQRSRNKKRFEYLLKKEEAFREWERDRMKAIQFIEVTQTDVPSLSAIATEVVRNHFDSLIGKEQNDYMLRLFQSQNAITEQLQHGYRYYWVMYHGMRAGFLAFYPRDEMMYLSKFYVRAQWRGYHLASHMVSFIKKETIKAGLSSVFLNVNRDNEPVISIYRHLGFTLLREEKNAIGNGYYMDDLVLILQDCMEQ